MYVAIFLFLTQIQMWNVIKRGSTTINCICKCITNLKTKRCANKQTDLTIEETAKNGKLWEGFVKEKKRKGENTITWLKALFSCLTILKLSLVLFYQNGKKFALQTGRKAAWTKSCRVESLKRCFSPTWEILTVGDGSFRNTKRLILNDDKLPK